MTARARIQSLLAVSATLSLIGAASSFAQSSGQSFTQLPGHEGCVRALGAFVFDYSDEFVDEEGPSPLADCDTASGLGNPQTLLVTPDQRALLVAAGGGDQGSNAVVTMNRSAANGALSFGSCMSNDAGDGQLGSDGACADAEGLSAPRRMALTKDGRWLYATSWSPGALIWFERDPTTGKLTQRGCLKKFAWPGEHCVTTSLLDGATGVALSPDARYVYVTGMNAGSLSVYRRDVATGDLTFASCVSDTGSDGLCDNVAGLRGAADIRVAPDGRGVYVLAKSSFGDLAAFDVDPTTGRLTERGCWGAHVAEHGRCTAVPSLEGAVTLALSPDGDDLYVGATGVGALTDFRRHADGSLDAGACYREAQLRAADLTTTYTDYVDELDTEPVKATEGCAPLLALAPEQLAISNDGRSVFTGGYDHATDETTTLDAFSRDPQTGALTWSGCAQEDAVYRLCADVRGLDGLNAIAVSADGRSMYTASSSTQSVAVFGASVAVARSASVTAAGRSRVSLACPASRPVACRGTLAHPLIRRAARYDVVPGRRGSVTVRWRPDAMRRLRHGHLRSVTLTVADAMRFTRPAHRPVMLRRVR